MFVFFFFKQKTAYEMRISDWSSDVCSSDLIDDGVRWRMAPHTHRPTWRSMLSPLPNLAYRCAAPALRTRLEAALAEEPWDLVVFDCLSEIGRASCRERVCQYV